MLMGLISLGFLEIFGLIITPIELRIDDVFDAHLVFEEMPDRKRWIKAAKNWWILCGSVVWEAALVNPKLAEDCWFCSKKEEFWEMFMFGCFSVAFISVLLVILSLVGVWVPFGFENGQVSLYGFVLVAFFFLKWSELSFVAFVRERKLKWKPTFRLFWRRWLFVWSCSSSPLTF